MQPKPEDFYNKAKEEVNRLAFHYGASAIPQHVEKRLNDILSGDSGPDMQKRSDKAVDVMFMHCLGEWARGKIRGPETPEYYKGRANKAEALAKMFEGKGNKEAAKRQRKKAKEYLKEAEACKARLDKTKT